MGTPVTSGAIGSKRAIHELYPCARRVTRRLSSGCGRGCRPFGGGARALGGAASPGFGGAEGPRSKPRQSIDQSLARIRVSTWTEVASPAGALDQDQFL